MTAISGTRRAMREMADGTIRVQIDIDPSCRKLFQEMFSDIDMPVALAPLRANFKESVPTDDKPKGGELAKLAGQLCNNPEFQKWLGARTADDAAKSIRDRCGIQSRRDLDHDPVAAQSFHDYFRKPFMARVTA